MAKDYYGILGVPRNADGKEIKKAFRKLAKEFHPDRNSSGDAAQKFKEINEAFSVLSDPGKRAKYDQYGYDGSQADGGAGGWSGFGNGASGFEWGGGFDGGDIFGDMGSIFDMFTGGARNSSSKRAGAYRGKDILVQIAIPLEIAAFGGEKTIRYKSKVICKKCGGSGADKGETVTCTECNGAGRVRSAARTVFGTFSTESICSKCDGSGKMARRRCEECAGEGRLQKDQELKIKIPGGTETAMKMRFAGYGEAGKKGGSAGDLYIVFSVVEKDGLKISDGNIIGKIKIHPALAAIGGTIEVPGVKSRLTLKIPKGTQTGEKFIIKGEGARMRNGRTGDEIITVKIEIPKRLSQKEKKLWGELLEESGRKKDFFEGLF